MRVAAISLNIALLLSAMWVIVAPGRLGTEGTVVVSIMIISGVVSLLNLYIDSQNNADSDHVRSLKEAVKEAELEKQLRDLREGNK